MDWHVLNELGPWEWPEGAGDWLIGAMENKTASVEDRVRAATLAGEIVAMNDDVAETLLKIASRGEEPEVLRAQAAISFGAVLEQTDIDGFEDEFGDEPPITEEMFDEVRDTLFEIYADETAPKLVRRRALEAAIRSQQDWQQTAIRWAYSQEDEDWKLTAVFCMRWVSGFNKEIVESLESKNPDIHFEAVCAAGNKEVDAAWPHVAALVTSPNTPKELLLAAIDAAASIRPDEAKDVLGSLTYSKNKEISEAAIEAIQMAELASTIDGGDDEDEEDDED